MHYSIIIYRCKTFFFALHAEPSLCHAVLKVVIMEVSTIIIEYWELIINR